MGERSTPSDSFPTQTQSLPTNEKPTDLQRSFANEVTEHYNPSFFTQYFFRAEVLTFDAGYLTRQGLRYTEPT